MSTNLNAQQVQRLQALVKQRCGLQFEGADTEKLVQAVHQRSQALGIVASDYEQAAQPEEEFQELVNLLTINETYFFREPEQIQLLVNQLMPRLLAHYGNSQPVRILSAGCSTGEEPYSLAMALWQKYGDNANRWFHIMGADIDSQALAKARAGRYSDFSFRGVAAAQRERFFTPGAAWRGWQISPEIQRAVSFYELNLLSDHSPAALQGCDVIFFRNVSIYFDQPTRKQIQRNLARLLKPDGVLMIGTAETLANDLGVLPLVEEAGLFYFVQGQPASVPAHLRQPNQPNGGQAFALPATTTPIASTPAAQLLAPQPLQVPAGWRMPAPQPPAAPPASLADCLAQAQQALHNKQPERAIPLLQSALAQASAAGQSPQQAQLLLAYALLERKDFAAAQTLAQQVLDADAWSVDACMLLGLAAKWSEQPQAAIPHFRQAIYAHQACWPAHYFLADALRSTGAVDAARRAWRVVLQLLPEEASAADAAQHGIRYLPLALPAQDIRFLCQRYLAQTAAQA